LSILTYPASIWRHIGGDPIGLSSRSLASKNYESLFYHMVVFSWSYVLSF